MKISKNLDYVFINKISHLLRQKERVIDIIKTKTQSKELNSKGVNGNYIFIATDTRIIILSSYENVEFSESFGYNELKNTVVVKGIFTDKVKLHRGKYKLSKSNARKFLKLSEYMPVKLATWKYYVFTFAFLLVLALAYKLTNYYVSNRFIFSNAGENKDKAKEINNSDKNSKKNNSKEISKPSKKAIDKKLDDILKGYKYAFKQIVKNYPVYYKKPALSGEPSSRFDTWVMREIINTLDAQDNKLSALELSLEKHVMFKLELSKLKLLIMRYLDICKKSFKQTGLRKKLKPLRKRVYNKIETLNKIIE